MIDMHQYLVAVGWAMIPVAYAALIVAAVMAATRTPRGGLVDVAVKAAERQAALLLAATVVVLGFTIFVRAVSDPNVLRFWMLTVAVGVALTPAAAVVGELTRRGLRRRTLKVQR